MICTEPHARSLRHRHLPRGSSGSATRYASERERHPRREPLNTRPLFTANQDQLKWKAADSHLAGQPASKPRPSNLHHLIFLFEKQDAKDLEALDPEDRDKGFRLATRAGMKRILDRLKVRDSRWAAVIHRHTPHTHVHVLLNKNMPDKETDEIKKINRFPQEMLNSRDPRTGKAADGLVSLDMAEAIDILLGPELKKGDSRIAPLTTPAPSTGADKTTLLLSNREVLRF